jgi:hypothetical protein
MLREHLEKRPSALRECAEVTFLLVWWCIPAVWWHCFKCQDSNNLTPTSSLTQTTNPLGSCMPQCASSLCHMAHMVRKWTTWTSAVHSLWCFPKSEQTPVSVPRSWMVFFSGDLEWTLRRITKVLIKKVTTGPPCDSPYVFSCATYSATCEPPHKVWPRVWHTAWTCF